MKLLLLLSLVVQPVKAFDDVAGTVNASYHYKQYYIVT